MDSLCYNNTIYYRLQISCPICLNNNRTTSIVFWTHYEDGGSMYIGSDGFLVCAKCRKRAHIRSWRFLCPNHSYSCVRQYSVSLTDGRCTSPEALLKAMGLSLPLMRKLSKSWICELIQNI